MALVDGLQIRMVLRTAGQCQWNLLRTDIHTAFLNIKPPGTPGPSILLAKQPKRTPMTMVITLKSHD